mmetsp:Transcript_1994/g.4701  ORF Transcript_1994/g.4701 Transcript_1994/m.4701 type:complete len:255 (-) Transcript_1994:506-1270(-)
MFQATCNPLIVPAPFQLFFSNITTYRRLVLRPKCSAGSVNGTAASSPSFSTKLDFVRRSPVPRPFPFLDEFSFDKRASTVGSDKILEVLEPLIQPKRAQKIQQVCDSRTFNVLPIVEGSINYGNISAVCRTSEALGFGAVHVINRGGRMKQSARTSAGADKWLDVVSWGSTADCLQHAKAAGFQVVVTHLREDAVDIADVDWTRPTAVLLGNEAAGERRGKGGPEGLPRGPLPSPEGLPFTLSLPPQPGLNKGR